MIDPEDRAPMTRTELAMLWDLLGRFMASHPDVTTALYPPIDRAEAVRDVVDDELTARFGG